MKTAIAPNEIFSSGDVTVRRLTGPLRSRASPAAGSRSRRRGFRLVLLRIIAGARDRATKDVLPASDGVSVRAVSRFSPHVPFLVVAATEHCSDTRSPRPFAAESESL